jgi:hypothetical protein
MLLHVAYIMDDLATQVLLYRRPTGIAYLHHVTELFFYKIAKKYYIINIHPKLIGQDLSVYYENINWYIKILLYWMYKEYCKLSEKFDVVLKYQLIIFLQLLTFLCSEWI